MPSLLEDPAVLRILLLALVGLLAMMWLGGRRARLLAEARAADLDTQLRHLAEETRATALRMGQQQARSEVQADRLSELTEERDGLADALHQARQLLAAARTELAETRLRAEKDAEAAAREIGTLRELRQEMTAQFKLLATETLRAQQGDMQRAQGEQLSALLNPFREQVHRFQTELQARNKVLDEEGARLREQISFLNQRSEDISREAVNLTRALKGVDSVVHLAAEVVEQDIHVRLLSGDSRVLRVIGHNRSSRCVSLQLMRNGPRRRNIPRIRPVRGPRELGGA